jgi:DNA-binding NarL/FixJ family response regulator
VVILSQYVDEGYAFELFRNGRAGLAYMLKDRVGDLTQLLATLRGSGRGRLGDRPAGAGRPPGPAPRVAAGTDDAARARVLREMAQGHGNAGIATRLSLSESSVEKYVNSTFAELGLTAEIQVHPPGRGGAALPARLRTGQPACAPVTDDADAVQVMGEPPVTPSTSPVM